MNRFNKTNERFLILSESHLYKLDPRKGKLMRGEKIDDVMGVSCGTRGHQLVVLHMRDKKDLVMSLLTATTEQQEEDRVGELIAVLATVKK